MPPVYVNTQPIVETLDGLVHTYTSNDRRSGCIMPRSAALALGRALFAAVARLEDAEAEHRPALLPCQGCHRA